MGTFMRNGLTADAESVASEVGLSPLHEEFPVADWSGDGLPLQLLAGDDWDEDDDDSFEDDDEEEFFEEDDDEEFEDDDDDDEEDEDFDDDGDE